MRSRSAAASAAGRSGSTSSPSTPLSTSSGMPPTRDATIGQVPRPWPRARRSGWPRIATAARRRRSPRAAAGTSDRSPRNRTWAPSPGPSTSRFSDASQRSVADEKELGVGSLANDDARRPTMSVSWPFSGRRLATVTTRRIGRPRHRGAGANAAQSTPLVIVRIFARRDAFAPELRGGGRRVGDHGMGRRVGQPLTGKLTARLVRRDELAPVADADVDAGERRRRQAKDVRVELARVHDARVDAAAPPGERQPLLHRGGTAEPAMRERRDRGDVVRRPAIRARRADGSTRRGLRTRCGRADESARPSAARFRRRRSWSGERQSDTVDVAARPRIEQAKCHYNRAAEADAESTNPDILCPFAESQRARRARNYPA